jgi:hypothetical protein
MRTRLVLRLHFTFHAIFVIDNFVLFVLFVVFELVVKHYVFLKFVFVVQEERMLHDIRKTQPFLAVYNENSFEEVLKIVGLFL